MDASFEIGPTSREPRLVARAFPPGYPDGPLARLSTLAFWLRPIFCALAITAALAFPDVVPHRRAFLHVTLIVLLPYALVTTALGRHRFTPTYRALTLAGDLGVVFAFGYSLPQTHVTTLFAYALIVTYAASSTGGGISFVTLFLAIGMSVTTNARAGASDVDPYVLASFGAVLGTTVLVVQAATSEVRSQLTHQARMQASMLSHELRTSLMSIDGFARTLIQRWDDIDYGECRVFLEGIAANTSEMEQLVTRMLELSRIEEGAWTPEGANELLRPAVESLAQTLAPTLTDHSITVDIDSDLSVRVDPFALRRVLGNLLTNAAKFSPAGAPIDVRARPSGNDVQVTVTDSGPGIPDSDRERIFSPYYRGSGERPVVGAGLGLLLARRYAETQGGHIRVDPGAGGGSVFTVTLPSAKSFPTRAKKHRK